ncbi:MAG TPA: hypothetical protein ENJ09_01465 [Planctomycetes bacterium]|nr:hypothetical protein [Planctomycetota bacterium]
MKNTPAQSEPTGRPDPTLPFHRGSARRVRPLALAAWTALFAVALLAFTAPIRSWVDRHPRLRFDDRVWAKQALGSYLQGPERFSGVFLGSSRVARGIIPRAFDAELTARGVEVHTLNLGRLGMNFVELSTLARRLLRWDPGSLRFAVIELTDFDPKFLEVNRRTPRLVGWHTPRATRDMLAVLWSSERTLHGKLVDSFLHVVECADYLGNVGLASRIARTRSEPTGAYLQGAVARASGYNRAETDEVLREKAVARLHTLEPPRPGRAPELTAVERRLLLELDRDLRSAGIQPIYLRMPGFRREGAVLDAVRAKLVTPVIDPYAEPGFEGLFVRESFQDLEHLNHDGAKRFSRLLADRIAPLLGRN